MMVDNNRETQPINIKKLRTHIAYEEETFAVSGKTLDLILGPTSPRIKTILAPVLHQQMQIEAANDGSFTNQLESLFTRKSLSRSQSEEQLLERLKILIQNSVEGMHQEQERVFNQTLQMKEKEIEQQRLRFRIALVGIGISISSMIGTIVAYYFPPT